MMNGWIGGVVEGRDPREYALSLRDLIDAVEVSLHIRRNSSFE